MKALLTVCFLAISSVAMAGQPCGQQQFSIPLNLRFSLDTGCQQHQFSGCQQQFSGGFGQQFSGGFGQQFSGGFSGGFSSNFSGNFSGSRGRGGNVPPQIRRQIIRSLR